LKKGNNRREVGSTCRLNTDQTVQIVSLVGSDL